MASNFIKPVRRKVYEYSDGEVYFNSTWFKTTHSICEEWARAIGLTEKVAPHGTVIEIGYRIIKKAKGA